MAVDKEHWNMRIWTIQPKALYEKLKIEKRIYCDPSKIGVHYGIGI